MKVMNIVIALLWSTSMVGAGQADFTSSYSGNAMIRAVPAVVQPAPSNLAGGAITRWLINCCKVEEIILHWQDNSRNEYTFRIERCDGATCKNFTEVAKLPQNTVRYYTGAAYQPGKVVRFRVRARGPYGFSAYSNIVNVTLG